MDSTQVFLTGSPLSRVTPVRSSKIVYSAIRAAVDCKTSTGDISGGRRKHGGGRRVGRGGSLVKALALWLRLHGLLGSARVGKSSSRAALEVTKVEKE